MISRLAADAVVFVHFLFIVFVVAGALLCLRWPRVAWLHVPAFLWGAAISFGGWICFLTPLENQLRRRGGEPGYEGSFIDRYLVPLVYPEDLTRERQVVMGVLVLLLNALVYGVLIHRRRKRRRSV